MLLQGVSNTWEGLLWLINKSIPIISGVKVIHVDLELVFLAAASLGVDLNVSVCVTSKCACIKGRLGGIVHPSEGRDLCP